MLTPALAIVARVAAEPSVIDPVEFLQRAHKAYSPTSAFKFDFWLKNGYESPLHVDTKFTGKLFKDGDGYTRRFTAPAKKLPPGVRVSYWISYSFDSPTMSINFESSHSLNRADFRRHTWLIELTGVGDPKRLFKVIAIAIDRSINSPQGHRLPTCTMWNEVDH